MTNRSEIVLHTENLQKHFGPTRAVETVSLDVRRGEVFGFLGPNGGGKTTTIGMLLGLIHPTGGRIEILGKEVTPFRTAALRQVGSLVGASPALVPYLTARQNLDLVARLHRNIDRARIDEVLQLVKLVEAAHRRADRFSTGMKQRLGLGMALLHRPDLPILDEPTNGMDPAGMREMRTFLRSLADEGITIFVSSHLLHEVEQMCDRVAVLHRGTIVAQGAVDELRGATIVRVRVSNSQAAIRALPGGIDAQSNGVYVDISGMSSEEVIVRYPDAISGELKMNISGMSSEEVIVRLVNAGVVPGEVTTRNADLESLFLRLTQPDDGQLTTNN